MGDAMHTPGPWAVDVRFDVYAGDPKSGTRIDIARLFWVGALKHNAELITAAPDLLAALKEAREYVSGAAPDWHKQTQETLAVIDAAIAKAGVLE